MRANRAAICGLFCMLLAAGLNGGAWAAEKNTPPQSLPVLQYLGDRASRMEANLPPLPDNLAAWQKRREQVRRDLTALLGLPAREPMRAKVLSTRTDGDVIVEKVIYLWAERCYVPGIVVRSPRATGRLPALVVPPGFGGSSKDLAEVYYKPFVYEMARKGYVVLFFDDPSFGERNAPLAAWYAATSAAGTQGMGVQVFDTLRALDYLLTRKEVDPGRIGVAGLCQGSEQTWLAGALDDRFRIVVPVCGTTTYTEWARMPGYLGVNLSSADPHLRNVLRYTDWPEIGACVAPRPLYIASNSGDNWWPEAGYNKVVSTLQKVYSMHGKPEQFAHLCDLRSHSMTPYLRELAPWIDLHLKALPPDTATVPQPRGNPPADADLNPLHYIQRQIVRKAEALPAGFGQRENWERYRQSLAKWLRRTCLVDEMHLGEARSEGFLNAGDLKMETMAIVQDQGLILSVKVYNRASAGTTRQPAVVLSHAAAQSATCPEVMNVVRALTADGYLVAVPDHASTEGRSARPTPSVVSLYGAGDTTGLSPLAMRVWDDLAALAVVRRRGDAGQVGMVGLGVGGVDAAVTAALDENVAAVAVVGAITVRDWVEKVTPSAYQVMPYLPDIMAATDWQYVYSAALPRPLLLVNATDRANWPAEAFRRVERMAKQVASLQGAADHLTSRAAASPWGVDEIRAWLKCALPQKSALVKDFTQGTKPDPQSAAVSLELKGVMGIADAPDAGGKSATQIYISAIEPGSTSAGILRAGDVLLGVNGKPFTHDAVAVLNKAVADARRTGKDYNLRLLHWRNGTERMLDFFILPPPPDLTKGEEKTGEPDWNLGPTGARGWIFSRGFDTSDARQIQVTRADKGSPCDGLLAKDDVILGVNGKPFESDARIAFGRAITAAETAENKGLLKLLRWRRGAASQVTIPLQVMGAYTDTSPYDCPKARRIVEQGCRAILKRGLNASQYSPSDWMPSIPDDINALALLASGNPGARSAVKAYAHKLVPPEMHLVLKEGMFAWTWSYANLFLTEYYLATGDDYVLPAIREITRKIALGQSAIGTYGHGFRVPGNNGTLGGYGAINQAGLICWMSMALAQKCGVDDPEVQRAVAKSRTFFSFYIGKGSVPYGDHPPYWLHDDNGKSSSAGITFDILGDQAGARFFTRMATAAYGEKELGHTGNYLGYLWGALAANRAGPAAVAAFLKEQRWYYDLARRWDGSFFTTQRDNYDWDMTGLFVLHEALPLKQLVITGKGLDGANFLSGAELQAVIASGRDFNLGHVDYAYLFKSDTELLAALGDWSPTVRKRAAMALAKSRADVVPRLITLLESPNLHARYGACQALQYLESRAAGATDALIRQLSEKDMWLRVQAAYALTGIGRPALKAVPQLLKMSVVVNAADPRGLEAKYFSYALFRSDFIDQVPRPKGLISDSLAGVDRELVYPAIRRMLASDDGLGTFAVRSIFKTLSTEELMVLKPEIIKVARDTAPSGEMFAQEIRVQALQFMAKNQIVEGLPVFIEYAKTQNGWGEKTKEILPLLKEYGPAAREILPELKALQTAWKADEAKRDKSGATRSSVAEEVIRAIEETKP